MQETEPDSVYVSVCDTGRGIGPEARARIFDRLYQDPDSIDNNQSGLGLGLFICRELIRLHQRNITVASELAQGSTFTFAVPVYSLAELLSPVITYQGKLRPSFVLVQVDLKPLTNPPRGNWKGTWQECQETLKRCVYLDKDLVLPSMGSSGPAETFFVVTSTDLQHSGIMTTRIREQLERIADLTNKATLTITTLPVELSPALASEGLEEQVQRVAECVTGMVMKALGREQMSAANGS